MQFFTALFVLSFLLAVWASNGLASLCGWLLAALVLMFVIGNLAGTGQRTQAKSNSLPNPNSP